MTSFLFLSAAGTPQSPFTHFQAYLSGSPASGFREGLPKRRDRKLIEVNQFYDDVTDPVDRWNIANRSSDQEMGAALDYLLEQIARNPESSLRELETDEVLYRERNEIAFDKFIDILWYSPNLGLKKKIIQVWARIDDWSKVERIFQQSGSQINSEKLLYAIASLREDVRHSKYHFDAEYVGNLEMIEKRIRQTPPSSLIIPGSSL